MWAPFSIVGRSLAESAPVKSRKNLKVKWSMGMGAWARVPWIAVMDVRETTVVSDGLYAIYLFRADMTGLYATLNQGVTKSPVAALRERTGELRRLCVLTRAGGFETGEGVDLRAKGQMIEAYEIAAVTHKFYPRDNLPRPEQFLADLEALLADYETCLRRR